MRARFNAVPRRRGTRLVEWAVVVMLSGTLSCSDDSDDAATGAGGAPDGGASGSAGGPGSGAGGEAGNPSGSSAGGSGGSCKTAGQACGPSDYCNAWICHCLNSTTDFNTVGSCDGGMCSTGEDACAPICAPNGGVMEAIDDGCF